MGKGVVRDRTLQYTNGLFMSFYRRKLHTFRIRQNSAAFIRSQCKMQIIVNFQIANCGVDESYAVVLINFDFAFCNLHFALLFKHSSTHVRLCGANTKNMFIFYFADYHQRSS